MSELVEDALGAVGGLITRRPAPFDGVRPYLATADVVGSHVHPAEQFDFRGLPARAGLALRENDVLQAKMAGTDKAVLVSEEMDGWLASTGFAQFSPSPDELLPGYLYQWLRSDEFFRQKESLCVGSTQKAINQSDLSRIRIRFPDTKHQQRVVDILSFVDDTIAKTEELIAKTQQIKAGLMHALFTRGVTADGQLRPPREQSPELYQESPLGWIPVEWRYTICSDVCEKVIDCKNRTPPELPDGFPVIRTPNVRNGEFVDKELVYTDEKSYLIWTARGKPQPGDIVITREAPVGEVCMIPERHANACLGQRMMLYRPDESVIAPGYLLYALQSRQVQNRLDLISGGSTVGHVRVGDIRDLWMFVPDSREEQELISCSLEAITKKLREEKLHLEKLCAQKLGLMVDLLTGRVGLPVPAEA